MAVQSVTCSLPVSDRAAAVAADSLFFFSNLRVFATVVVILHHVGQAYGPTGGEWPIQEQLRAAVLGPFFTVNRSFGMSLFFLIAGYFMVRSFDSHGPAAFVRSRLTRLGIPLAVFMVLSVPFMVLMGTPSENGTLFGLPAPHALHLWFVQHLLIYSLVYAGARTLLDRWRGKAGTTPPHDIPRTGAIVLFALGLAVVSAVVRTWFPIDRWLVLPGFIRVAFADVPRDLSFFVIGGLAYRHNWLTRFSSEAGRAWLLFALMLAALWYLFVLSGAAGPATGYISSIAFAVWESLLCCGMCIGLVVLFRDRLNTPTPIALELGRSQYLAYILHVIPVVALQAVALALPVPPIVKFLLVGTLAVGTTFLIASLLRRPLRL